MKVRGFTLLEILLVLAIVAMASVVVFPGLTGVETRTFNSRVREAHTLLDLARRTAVVSGQPSVVRLTVTPAPPEQETLPSPFMVANWDGSGMELIFLDSADRERDIEEYLQLTFYPEGGSTGGTLLLALQDRRARITVNPFTGRVQTDFLEGP